MRAGEASAVKNVEAWSAARASSTRPVGPKAVARSATSASSADSCSRCGVEENLSAARAYYAEAWIPAAPVTATALDKPEEQWLPNCHKRGGLGKKQAAAQRRTAQLGSSTRTGTRRPGMGGGLATHQRRHRRTSGFRGWAGEDRARSHR